MDGINIILKVAERELGKWKTGKKNYPEWRLESKKI